MRVAALSFSRLVAIGFARLGGWPLAAISRAERQPSRIVDPDSAPGAAVRAPGLRVRLGAHLDRPDGGGRKAERRAVGQVALP